MNLITDAIQKIGKLVQEHPAVGWWARDKEGKPISSSNPRACCWCLEGAYCKVCRDLKLLQTKDDDIKLFNELCRVVGNQSLVKAWDDHPDGDRGRAELAAKLVAYQGE